MSIPDFFGSTAPPPGWLEQARRAIKRHALDKFDLASCRCRERFLPQEGASSLPEATVIAVIDFDDKRLIGMTTAIGYDLPSIKRRLLLCAFATFLLAAIFMSTAHASSANEVISGRVLSGTIPINGAEVTLYGRVERCVPDPCFASIEAAAKSKTDSQGAFSLDLSKATIDVFQLSLSRKIPVKPYPVHVVASGGNAGGGFNPAIKLLLVIKGLPLPGAFTINELTTVASVLSLGPSSYYSWTPERIEAGAQFERTHSYVEPHTGKLRTVLKKTHEAALVNTLADLLAGCVRSSGPGALECARLFESVPPLDGGGRIADTLAAVESIARKPATNVSRLFALLPNYPVYKPTLASPPHAWRLSE